MSKTLKNCFYDKLIYDNFLSAHYRAKKNKRKKEIYLYEMDLETNLINLMNEIVEKKYKMGKYREFIVYEPKQRIIKSLPYRDRIVHQWYIEEFIKPYYIKRFISDSYACIENKGTHKAVKKLQGFMRKMKKLYPDYYIIKCDIKKYFYNIDRKILFNILKRNINDKELLNFTRVLIGNDDELGIPIGNYTSQFFANIYLNELDHYVKEKLNIKFCLRYMDDFIFLVKDKECAKDIMEKVKFFLVNVLHLELNKKSRYYPNKFGCDFCGYIIFENYILLRKRFKTKIKRKIKKWNNLYLNNKLDKKKFLMQWNCFLAHASHSNSYNFINKCKNNLSF